DEWRDRSPDAQALYRHGQRHVPALEPMDGAGFEPPLSVDGTWLITGGAGGLGFLLARHLSRNAGVRLVLSGRAAPSPAIEQRLQALRDAGAQALYHPCDVTVETQVRDLIDASGRLGPLRGIVHAAGLTRDARLGDKHETAFADVLAVKRLGALHLDRATSGMPLDFFVLCSSMAGLMGNAGQVDYAYANAWLDHFAEQREAERRRGLRSGLTRAIAWPPLGEGGMTLDPGSLEWLRSRFGLVPLDARGSIATFEAALRCERPRLLAVAGDAKRLRQSLIEPAARQPERERAPATHGITAHRRPVIEAARALLRALLSETLRVPEGRIDLDESLDVYGVDSVSAMALARELEARIGAVPRTLFLEYPTLAELADYLVEHHATALTPTEETAAPRASSPPSSPLAAPVLAEAPRRAGKDSDPALGDDELIAIIGMAGRFPGAPDIAAYWENLRLGRSSIVEVPASRWAFCDDEGAGGSRWGGFLDDIDRFDHALFQIAQVEAVSMDPAERLFLEIAWETLEHAGYPRSRRAEAQRRTGLGTGVFVGCMYRQYAHIAQDARTRGLLSNGSYWSIANRASWFFDLQGPSVALDNACAAGLTSVHQACRALADGECEMALAGAVNLSLHPHKYTGLGLMGLMSASPAPRLFGNGDGFVPGEGVAAVLLKPLSRAQADGDRILAVIRASRVNHGGRTPGFTVPGVRAQAELVSRTLERAGLGPQAIDYLELAANGSDIGDMVEQRALSRVFGGAPPGSIPVGSTKAALGHLEAASGLAQLIKVVLQLRHRELCPSVPAAEAETSRLPDESPFRL
ncbi:MAG TPA: type I polyketide synthase, partial [Candidatus Nanopelagicales bacterium]|nr:type I polyketide synthase [Candidatus Nanopelagicales bacterium]